MVRPVCADVRAVWVYSGLGLKKGEVRLGSVCYNCDYRGSGLVVGRYGAKEGGQPCVGCRPV